MTSKTMTKAQREYFEKRLTKMRNDAYVKARDAFPKFEEPEVTRATALSMMTSTDLIECLSVVADPMAHDINPKSFNSERQILSRIEDLLDAVPARAAWIAARDAHSDPLIETERRIHDKAEAMMDAVILGGVSMDALNDFSAALDAILGDKPAR